MKRVLTRLATLAVALPLVAGLSAGTAQAATSVTVPGCYGAGSAVYCDVTVTVGVPIGVGTYETTIPVCAGTCVYVPVTLVGTAPGEPLNVCYSYRRLDGSTFSDCGGSSTGVVDDLVRYVEEQVGALGPLVDEIRYIVETAGDQILYYVRELRRDPCSAVVQVINSTGLFNEVQCA